jgi:hypothetical protein
MQLKLKIMEVNFFAYVQLIMWSVLYYFLNHILIIIFICHLHYHPPI